MKQICSFCNCEIGSKPPFDEDIITHGMCDECFEYFRKQIKGLSLGEYLDRFSHPVIVVDNSVRVIAMNQSMGDILGKSERDVLGLLGGDALECFYARLPEGCGNTIHCKTCTIRRNITETIETGIDKINVPAYLLAGQCNEITMTISTYKEPYGVRVIIDSLKTADKNHELC